MLRKPKFATTIVNLYIMTFLIVLEVNFSQQLIVAMLYFAPVISVWMFYTLINGSNLPALKR